KLREVPGIKIFIIAIVWAIICGFLPATATSTPGIHFFSFRVIAWSLCLSLLIFSLTIPFDIRDHHYDGEKLKTIPSITGIRRSVVIANGSLLFSALIVAVLVFFFHTGSAAMFAAYAAWCIPASVLIAKSSPKRSEYYFSFWVDGLMILLFLLLWAADFIQRFAES
ncbi:MAG TPA: hypothetical protein VFU15_07880, partial [Bacteroidia bacterium]|nr:hypothetical protein [Bacteroidia bacterium]